MKERPSPSVHHDVVIVLTYYAPYVSGLTNVAKDVAEGLAARGWRVCVIASKHDPTLPTHDQLNGVRIVRAPVLARIGKGTIGVNLTRLARHEMRHARVVNLHLPLIEAGLLARLAPVPVVSTYHCDVTLPPGAVNVLQRRVMDRASTGALRRSATTVVSSEDYARRSRVWEAIRPSMAAIPPPCEPQPGGRPTFRDGDGFHIGFLGRLVEEKGVEHLVDAFRALDDPDARLLVGGDYLAVAGGSVVDRIRRHAGDDPRIRLLGFIADDDLPDFYASLDTFALPSVNAFEAFGIVQVVAMLAGVPAVVSDLPGVRTVVRSTGFGEVVPPGDVAALTTALRRMRDDPPDAVAGRAAAESLYSVETVLDAYEAVLTKARLPDHHHGGIGVTAEDVQSTRETDGGFARVSRTWTRLGAEDPMWAVLTDTGKSGNRWDDQEFLATGRAEIAAVMRRLDDLGVAPANGRAVDFGCGAGRLSHGLAEAGFGDVLGLDISPTMLASARETVPSSAVRFARVEGPTLDAVGSQSVDLVYCCRVLQHMPPELAHGYVAEFLRLIRPGGVAVFQMPTVPARTPAGLAVRLLPDALVTRLRKGMEMHGTPEHAVRALVAAHGARVVAADEDSSAGPRWQSRLYIVTKDA